MGEVENAINHLETALRIATSFSWHGRLSHSFERLFSNGNRLGDAQVHIEWAESHATTKSTQSRSRDPTTGKVWYKQRRLEEAKSEASRAVDVFEKLGTSEELRVCKANLQDIEEAIDSPAISR